MNALKRVATAVVLIPIVLGLVLRAPIAALAAVAGLVALLAVEELLRLSEAYGIRPLRWPTLIFVALFFLLLGFDVGAGKPLLSTAAFACGAALAATLAAFVFLSIAMRRADLTTGFRIRFHLRLLAARNARASPAAMVRSISGLVSAPRRLGGRCLRVLYRTIPWARSDVSSHQPKKNLGRSLGFNGGQSDRGNVAVQLCAPCQFCAAQRASNYKRKWFLRFGKAAPVAGSAAFCVD